MNPPKKCPKNVVGDIQLESILTPIMFQRIKPPFFIHGNPLDTQPELWILDVGCGWGRLLGGLALYPQYVTKRIHYVGCEESEASLQASVAAYEDMKRSMPVNKSLEARFASVEFITWDSLHKQEEDKFDFIYLVNVLHHIPPVQIPDIYSQIFPYVKDDSYLIIHDLFLDDYDQNTDFEKYCEDCVFFSPRHVSAFFSMASSQAGLYRVIPRLGENGQFSLFTFILQFSNELSKTAFRESEDFFTHEYMPPGILASLTEIARDLTNTRKKDWLLQYRSIVLAARDEVRKQWKHTFRDSIAVYGATRWLDSTKS